MADGDSARSSIRISGELLNRSVSDKSPSYFFNQQVQTCFTEQDKILGFQLSEKEKEAQVTYEKSLTDLFGPAPQIESTFAKIIFDSTATVTLEGLVEELSTLANVEKGDGSSTTRLLDLLFVSRNFAGLREEQEIRSAQYDLYDAKVKGKFGSMALLPKLISKFENRQACDLAWVFSNIAAGEEELLAPALVYLAYSLCFPWDALVLARYYFGANHEVTKMVREAWTQKVMNDSQFKMIKIACSLDSNQLIITADELINLVSSKNRDPVELVQAYRCLALTLKTNFSNLPDFERNLEVKAASRMMYAIFVTTLGFGQIHWAKCIMDDIAKRAPPSDIPTNIFQIGLRCHIELVELLLNIHKIKSEAQTTKTDDLEKLALRWRDKVNRGNEGMEKLKAKTAGEQKVIYKWITDLCGVLQAPLVEEHPHTKLNPKMQCALLAARFLAEMLRWAVYPKEGEQLELHMIDEDGSITINDKWITIVSDGRRSRAMSIGSSRSASVAKEDSKKQKKKGDVKEERQTPPAQETRNPQRGENKERPYSLLRHDATKPFEQSGGAIHGPGNQQSNIGAGGQQWERGVKSQSLLGNQDVRKSQHHTGGNENSGLNTHGTAPKESMSPISMTDLGLNTPQSPKGFGTQTQSSHRGGALSAHPSNSPVDQGPSRGGVPSLPQQQPNAHYIPVSASSSSGNVATPLPAALAAIQKAIHQKQEDAGSQQSPISTTTNEQHSTTTYVRPSSPKTPTENVTQEQIQARLEETLKKNARVETTKGGEAASGQQFPPSSPLPATASISQQSNVDTAVEARSMENVQPVQFAQSDAHYEELMKQSDRSIAPDPAEMNKLFTGTDGGQSTLPPNVQAEQDAAAAAASLSQSLPVPAAAPTAPSSSAIPTQLAYPQGIVLPSAYDATRTTYNSTSAESLLTPITEASQEFSNGRKSTFFSESGDAPSEMANDQEDNVFEESVDPNQTIYVETQQLPQSHSSVASSTFSLTNIHTPTVDEIDSQHNSPFASDTPKIISPQQAQASPVPTDNTLTDSSQQQITVEQTTLQNATVRDEARDTNQQHQPILHPVPQQQPLGGAPTTMMTGMQQQQNQVSGGYTSLFASPPAVSSPLSPLPPAAPMEMQQPAQQQQFSAMEISVQQPLTQSFPQQSPADSNSSGADTIVSAYGVPQIPLSGSVTTAVSRDEMTFSPPLPTGQPLVVDCAEVEVQDLVTSCGVPYKYSPVKDEVTSPSTESMGAMGSVQQSHPQQQQITLEPPGFLDSLLGMGSLGEVKQEASAAQQTGMPSSSMDNTQWGVTADEIDEHAAVRRTESSERGDIASEFGGSSAPHPFPADIPSVPSTAVTTPDPSYENQFDYGNGPYGGDVTETPKPATHNIQIPQGGIYMGQQSPMQSQPQSFQQMHEPLRSEELPQQPSRLPAYHDPFEHAQQQPQQPPMHQIGQPIHNAQVAPQPAASVVPVYKDPFEEQQQRQQSIHQRNPQYAQLSSSGFGNQNQMTHDSHPSGFRGNVGGAQTGGWGGQKEGGAGDQPHFGTFGNQSNEGSGQNQFQTPGFTGQDYRGKTFYGNDRGGRGGDRGRGERRGGGGERRGGRGGSFERGGGRGGGHSGSGGFGRGGQSGFNGFGGSQDFRGTSQQQQQGESSAGFQGTTFNNSGDYNQHKSNFGGQTQRGGTGFRRGAP